MSLVKCHTSGCPWEVREGLRRDGLVKGAKGQELADGKYCWRCRERRITRYTHQKEEEHVMPDGDEICDCMYGDTCSKCDAVRHERKDAIKHLTEPLKQSLNSPAVTGVTTGNDGKFAVFVKKGTVVGRPGNRPGKVIQIRIVGSPKKKIKRGIKVDLVVPHEYEGHKVMVLANRWTIGKTPG